jgi:hypothetical protein
MNLVFVISINLLSLFGKNSAPDKTLICEAGKAPTYLACYCNDGSIYSYGNYCKTGASVCIPNTCPPQPDGCSGN